MKRRNKKKERALRTIRLWTLPEAEKALPYLHSITGSLREHWLEALNQREILRQLTSKAGRPDREAILAQQAAELSQSDAEDRFGDALKELMKIDVYLLDPVQGLAFIPFNKDDELAWLVYDLFEQDGLKTWRYHKDPMETRRPISEALTATRPPQDSDGSV